MSRDRWARSPETSQNRSERDSNPRYRLTRYTAFPDRGSGVLGGALGGTPYSDSKRSVHHKAGDGTRVGSALGLDFGLSRRRWSATDMASGSRRPCAETRLEGSRAVHSACIVVSTTLTGGGVSRYSSALVALRREFVSTASVRRRPSSVTAEPNPLTRHPLIRKCRPTATPLQIQLGWHPALRTSPAGRR
jgi:hypothetical protein